MAYIPESLRSSFHSVRRELLARQAEECLTLEHVTEQVEEREFDEQERLRVHRRITREVEKSTSMRAYRQLAASLQASGQNESGVREQVEQRIEQDLRTAGEDPTPSAVARYAQIIPQEKWPRVLAAGSQLDRVKTELLRRGLHLEPASAAERLGVVKFACPPEEKVLDLLGQLDAVDAFDDPNSSVIRVQPAARSKFICNHKAMLRLPAGTSELPGENVTIAILDAGIDPGHPAFSRMKPDDFRDFTGEGLEDPDGHGTHVASIAAGADERFDRKLSGIAPRAHLVVARVLPTNGIIPLEIVLEAMAWAIFDKKADVISMSIGKYRSPANGKSVWSRVCEEAVSHGTMVCVAAGNNEDGPCPDTIIIPADARLVVTVGALDPDGFLADFSARGNPQPESPLFGKPNSVAPGVNIAGARSQMADLPEVPGTGGLYTGMSGTSMATPMVAGCLALMKAKALDVGWNASARELIDVYYAACRPLKDEHGTPYCRGSEIGHGLVDMEQALALIEVKRQKGAAAPVAAAAGAAAPVPNAPVPNAPEVAATQSCASCGHEYRSKVSFQSDHVCRACGRPICKVCWASGRRNCAQHERAERPRAVRLAAPEPAVAEPIRPPASKIHTADAFLNAFDSRVREQRVFHRPGDNHEQFIDEKHRYEFVRTVGKIVQYECKPKGFFSGPGMHLNAIVLAAECGGDSGDPPEDLLEQIAGRNGLEVAANQFHICGVFSRGGWPEGFRARDLSRGNLKFVFVEPGEGSLWAVYPEDGEFRGLFDPETDDQKRQRARSELDGSPELSTMGGTVALDALCRKTNLPAAYVERAVAESHGRFRTVEHRGKKNVLRASVI